jgi:hypothetical protein
VVLSDARKGSAKGILCMFENSSNESVEQSTKLYAKIAEDSESNGYECSTAGVDDSASQIQR